MRCLPRGLGAPCLGAAGDSAAPLALDDAADAEHLVALCGQIGGKRKQPTKEEKQRFWSMALYVDELRGKAVIEREFEPTLEEASKEKLYAGWKKAVSRTRDWEPHEENN